MVVEMIESQENGFVDLESELVQTTINVSESSNATSSQRPLVNHFSTTGRYSSPPRCDFWIRQAARPAIVTSS